MKEIQGRRPPYAKMEGHMEELGHFRTPKDLVFLLSKKLFHVNFSFLSSRFDF